MSWQLWLIIALVGVAAVGTICLGLYIAITRVGAARIIWDLASIVITKFGPKFIAFAARRDTPEAEAAWRHTETSGVQPPPAGTGISTGPTISQPAATRRNRPKP